MTARVSVVIPNWNGARWLPTCLDALRRQHDRDFETIVVDNGSTDGSLALLARDYPDVRVIAESTNGGFAAAMNRGIAASRGELVAALNNDTEADPAWLGNLVAALDAAPADVGFCASRIMDFNRREVVDCIGDGYTRLGLSYKIGAGGHDDGRVRPPVEVLSACAAAALYRRAMLDEIGVFDEAFFAYMEDVDLGLRAQLAGYRCLAVPSAVVYHVGSATSGGGASAFAVRLTTRNLLWVIAKTMSWRAMPAMLLLAIATQVGLVGLHLVTGRPAWLGATRGAWARGLLAGLRGLPAMLAKRRTIARRRSIDRWIPLLPPRRPLTPPDRA